MLACESLHHQKQWVTEEQFNLNNMHIQLFLIPDSTKSHMAFWSGRIIQNNEVKMEVRSESFIPGDKFSYNENYERCTVRIMKELTKTDGQGIILDMFLKEGQQQSLGGKLINTSTNGH